MTLTCVRVKSLQSCPTLCEPMDQSPRLSSVHGILQSRILEWVAMPSSRVSSWPRDQTCVSYISCLGRWVPHHLCHLGFPWCSCVVLSHWIMSDSVTPRTVASQNPWGFSRQEYWSGLPCSPPGELPNPEIKPRSPALQVISLPSEPPGKPIILTRHTKSL